MAGRTGTPARWALPGLVYLVGNEANGFQPEPPNEPVDVVYLCSPNNPTGTVATRAQLEKWVAWAQRERRGDPVRRRVRGATSAIPSLPHSIYEIPGAKDVRDRAAQLLQARGLHRRALRVHGRAEGA